MSGSITWIFVAFAILLMASAIRRLLHRRNRRSGAEPSVDDDAIERILAHGTIGFPDDEPLDQDEIARAEAEFWEETWDDPQEYER